MRPRSCSTRPAISGSRTGSRSTASTPSRGCRPRPTPKDRGFRANHWIPGSYRASYETLRRQLEQAAYRNFRLHAGYFETTLTDELLAQLREAQPILIWVDCDLYTSSRTVMERLIPILPAGCVIYFDDLQFNHRSRFTGQARLIHEINTGMFGADIELVVDPELS
jgi:Macrocin-O-methyltransferase (TylF)